MPKYTVRLGDIVESLSGRTTPADFGDIAGCIDDALPKIFNFPWPIFNEDYRSELEKKIVYHYYTREIGLETYGLFKLKLQTKLNEVMPYFNQLYKSQLLEFNPFDTMKLERLRKKTGNDTHNRTDTQNDKRSITTDTTQESKGDGSVTDSGKTTHTDAYSDTPQSTVENVENLTYLTDYRSIMDDANNTTTTRTDNSVTSNGSSQDTLTGERVGNETINREEDYIETITGKTNEITYSKMLMELRQSFLNIDMQVIDSLEELFMMIY